MGTDPQGGLARSSRPEHHSDADACGARLAGAAWLLLAGTLVLVVDVAVEGVALPGGSLNLVNDVAGAVLVLMGAQRVATAARAAAPLAGQVLIGLAVLNLLAALAGELGADKPVQVAAAWVQLGGVTALAWILQHASNGLGRHNLAVAWRRTRRLTVVLYGGSLVAGLLVGDGMEAALGQPGAPGNALPLVVALASVVALVALLYSLHQTTKLATSVRPRPTDGPATRDPEASW